MGNRRLEVYYHKKHVGTLAEMPDKRIAFQYSTEWQKTGFSINPLSLPLTNDVHVPQEKNLEIFHGLFGTFADSLPDAWGDLLIRNYLSSIDVNPNELSILDRLAYIGSSGMGALEYVPDKSADFQISSSDLDYDSIANECSNILSSKESSQLDLLYNLAGSSGGTRPKILLKENNIDWIIKFPSINDPQISGKREYDYSLCAKKCGISMTETGLIPSSVCDGYFKIARFDRDRNNKVFTSTFAGLLNVDFNTPTCDYSTYMRLIQVLTKDNEADKQQMFRQMCFNVLTHNRDDHTKNFSFIFSENNGWRLAPAYDITYSTTYYGEQTTSVNGKGKDITNEDFFKVGTYAGLSKDFMVNVLKETKEKIQDIRLYIESDRLAKRKKSPVKNRVEDLKKNLK